MHEKVGPAVVDVVIDVLDPGEVQLVPAVVFSLPGVAVVLVDDPVAEGVLAGPVRGAVALDSAVLVEALNRDKALAAVEREDVRLVVIDRDALVGLPCDGADAEAPVHPERAVAVGAAVAKRELWLEPVPTAGDVDRQGVAGLPGLFPGRELPTCSLDCAATGRQRLELAYRLPLLANKGVLDPLFVPVALEYRPIARRNSDSNCRACWARSFAREINVS